LVGKAIYDGLFDTFFIVISLAVAPFVSSEIASSVRAYQIWAALSFDLPLIVIVIVWGFAIFSDSIEYRIASWSALIFQIVRVPFVVATDILGITAYVQTPFWVISLPFEVALSMIPAYLIMNRYCNYVSSEPPKLAEYLAWVLPIVLLGAYTYVVSQYGAFYATIS
jgi:hypothetical protein